MPTISETEKNKDVNTRLLFVALLLIGIVCSAATTIMFPPKQAVAPQISHCVIFQNNCQNNVNAEGARGSPIKEFTCLPPPCVDRVSESFPRTFNRAPTKGVKARSISGSALAAASATACSVWVRPWTRGQRREGPYLREPEEHGPDSISVGRKGLRDHGADDFSLHLHPERQQHHAHLRG